MPECACGCGTQTAGGQFAPGHDQKLRTEAERRAGGVVALARLVEAAEQYALGHMPREDFEVRLRSTFKAKHGV